MMFTRKPRKIPKTITTSFAPTKAPRTLAGVISAMYLLAATLTVFYAFGKGRKF